MGLEEVGPTLELLGFDACRLAAALVEAAEAERLRRMTDHGRIALTARFVRSLIAARRLRPARRGGHHLAAAAADDRAAALREEPAGLLGARLVLRARANDGHLDGSHGRDGMPPGWRRGGRRAAAP